MLIGADIPLYGHETLVSGLLEHVAKHGDTRLYLAGKRHKKAWQQITNLCEVRGILDRVDFFPYYDRLESFPALKRKCDFWFDANSADGLDVLSGKAGGNAPVLLFFTAFHPQKDEGNSVAMRFWLDAYRAAGYAIHLVWYMYDARDVTKDMRDKASALYDHYVEIPVESRLTGMNSNGLDVHVDDWCGPEVLTAVRELADKWSYDVCFVNYTFSSAVFEAIKPYTEKILFTHDIFTSRNKKMLAQGYAESGWVSLTERGEALACRRADRILCLQEEDAAFFAGISDPQKVVTVAPLPVRHEIPLSPPKEVLTIGYLGSHNYVNEYNLVELLRGVSELDGLKERIRFRIGGGVSTHLREFAPSGLLAAVQCELLGRVDELADFYASCDVICNPERGGTGIKIKSLEALAHGCALISTQAGAIGLGSTHPMHNLPSISAMPQALLTLAEQSDSIYELRDISLLCFDTLVQKQQHGVSMVINPEDTFAIPAYVHDHASSYHVPSFAAMWKQVDLNGKVVVEIGSDRHLIMARLCVANGAKRVVTCNCVAWTIQDECPDTVESYACDFVDLALEPHSVDVIFGIALLEHITDYPAVMEKIRLLLKPEGRVYLQGEPLWTSPRGHHLDLMNEEGTEAQYSFYGNNPIPHWSHLVLTPEEMAETLAPVVQDNVARCRIVDLIYNIQDHIASNKLLPSVILRQLEEAFYIETLRSEATDEANEYFSRALEKYTEADLRCSGLTVSGRLRVFQKQGTEKRMLSVVIPCYNVEEYVAQCIESVLAQSYVNLEVILVDDASTDGTGNLLTRYGIQDTRVRVIRHERNLGLGPARNTGAAHATGDLLFFLDSDDYLDGVDALESLVRHMDKHSCPVVVGSCRRLALSGTLETCDAIEAARWNGRPDSLYSGEDACLGAYMLPGSRQIPIRAWGTLISMSFYREANIPFPTGIHEDFSTIPFLYAFAGTVWYSSDSVVIYRERKRSLSNKAWGIPESSTVMLMWETMLHNIRRTDLDHVRPGIALRAIDHTLYKIGCNGIDESGIPYIFRGIAFIAESMDAQVDQDYFNGIYKLLRRLYDLSGTDHAGFKAIVQQLNPENVLAYYRAGLHEVEIGEPYVCTPSPDVNEDSVRSMYAEFHEQAEEKTRLFPAMLSDGDRAVYFHSGRHWAGEGEIVDIGCFVGGSTQALLDGLASNAQYADRISQIRVFDSFQIDTAHVRDWIERHYEVPTGDETGFRRYFDVNFVGREALIDVHEGDIAFAEYRQKTPIAFLGIGGCTSPAKIDNVVRQFFPYLIPGHSLVVHQDYVHAFHPYIHVSMELLNDCFEPAMEIDGGGSYVWRCTRRITPELIETRFGSKPVVSSGVVPWYANSEANKILLAKRQLHMLYPADKMMLGFVRAAYLKHMALEAEARELALDMSRQYPEWDVPNALAEYLGLDESWKI